MREYPAYRLEDFYRKSFLQGGVTYHQLIKMYDYKMRDLEDEYKFHAAIHGIDLDAELDEDGEPKPKPKKEQKFLFKDPAEYEKMSEQERAEENRKMMGHWRSFRMRSSPRQ